MLHSQASVDTFTEFVEKAEPRLRNALIPVFGPDSAREATADALGYGWEHWERLRSMDNPAGYLYRVAYTAARRSSKHPPKLPRVSQREMPHVEPGLPDALLRLSNKQRTAVWLVHGLQWRHTEVAELLDISADTVRTHAKRGLEKLRSSLGEVAT